MQIIIGLIIGAMLLAAGVYYLAREKDAESRKIYMVTCLAGAVIIAGCLIKAAIAGA